MVYSTTNLNDTLAETKTTLNIKFRKPKSETQCVNEIKEIKQMANEPTWDIDQRLNFLLRQDNLQISDEKHKEWYIASLFPHI